MQEPHTDRRGSPTVRGSSKFEACMLSKGRKKVHRKMGRANVRQTSVCPALRRPRTHREECEGTGPAAPQLTTPGSYSLYLSLRIAHFLDWTYSNSFRQLRGEVKSSSWVFWAQLSSAQNNPRVKVAPSRRFVLNPVTPSTSMIKTAYVLTKRKNSQAFLELYNYLTFLGLREIAV